MTTDQFPTKLLDEVRRRLDDHDAHNEKQKAEYMAEIEASNLARTGAARPQAATVTPISAKAGNAEPTPGDGAGLLGLRPVADIAAEVDAAPPRRWLFRRVWPSDAYGVVGAKHKAGKSWLMLGAAVAVAGGVPWLGKYETDTPGPVLFFAGEGGASKLTRRGRAVAADAGLVWDDLPILMSERVPTLTDGHHLAALEHAIDTHRPALVIIDPLYLAVGPTGDGKNLYAMGGVLTGAQHAAQRTGAALMVSHHNNRDASKTGADSLSGAGPAEWGRVLIALTVKSQSVDTDTGTSDTHLEIVIDGDEVAGGSQRFRRIVGADDQDDLASPMAFSMQPTDGAPDEVLPGAPPAQRRVLAVIEKHGADWLDKHAIGEHIAKDEAGPPLRHRTILDATKALAADGHIKARATSAGGTGAWRRIEPAAVLADDNRPDINDLF